jgi:hypothetical protein
MPKLPDFKVFERRRGYSGFDKTTHLMENRNGLRKRAGHRIKEKSK